MMRFGKAALQGRRGITLSDAGLHCGGLERAFDFG
jgi:hypothetical protein